MIGEIREATDRKTTWQRAEGVVKQLNRKLAGWANYFSLGPVNKAYRAIDGYTAPRPRSIRLTAREQHASRTSTSTTRLDS
jgi:RNA-directed DNA polymerase